MTENSRTMAATLAGALIGGVAGYLFLTEPGRSLRRQVELTIEDIARELNNFRGTLTKAAGIASEGWKLLGDAIGEGGPYPPRNPNARETSPF